MKSFLLFFFVGIAFSSQISTLTFPYEAHFPKDLPDVRNWTKHTNTVTIQKNSITISDGQKSFVYSITKGPVFREEKNYNVYHVVRNKTNYMIMFPLHNKYVNVINESDSTVWMLSKINF